MPAVLSGPRLLRRLDDEALHHRPAGARYPVGLPRSGGHVHVAFDEITVPLGRTAMSGPTKVSALLWTALLAAGAEARQQELQEAVRALTAAAATHLRAVAAEEGIAL